MSILKGGRNYLSFDGVNDYVDTGITSLDNNSGFEIKIDFNLQDANADNTRLFNKDKFGDPGVFIVRQDNTTLFFQLRNPSDTLWYEINSSSLNINQWYELKIIYDQSNQQIEMYIDNNLEDFTSFPFNSFNSNNLPIVLGADSNKNDGFFDGYLDNFSIIIGGNTLVSYDMNEGSGTTLNDSAGNNDGTINGATWGTPTVSYPAIDNIYYSQNYSVLDLDGVNDEIELSSFDSVFLNEAGSSGSIEISVKPNTLTGEQVIFGTNQNRDRFIIWDNGDLVANMFESTNGWLNPIVYTVNETNKWIDIAFTWDLSVWEIKLYVNGELVGQRNESSDTSAGNDSNTSIGYHNFVSLDQPKDYGPIADYFNGQIRLFRTWSTVLSQEQVSLYRNKVIKNPPSSLLIYYDFSDDSGFTLSDISGNNYDGNILDGTWQTEVFGRKLDKVYSGSTLIFDQPIFSPITATGGTVQDITWNGKLFREHVFEGNSNYDFVVSSIGTTDGSVYYELQGDGSNLPSGVSGSFLNGITFRRLDPFFDNNTIFTYTSTDTNSLSLGSNTLDTTVKADSDFDSVCRIDTFENAIDFIHSNGFRLLTVEEIIGRVSDNTGCGYDGELIWTYLKEGDDNTRHFRFVGDTNDNGSQTSSDYTTSDNNTSHEYRYATDVDPNRNDPVVVQDNVILNSIQTHNFPYQVVKPQVQSNQTYNLLLSNTNGGIPNTGKYGTNTMNGVDNKGKIIIRYPLEQL